MSPGQTSSTSSRLRSILRILPLAGLSLSPGAARADEVEARRLALEERVERRLAGGEVHLYRSILTPGGRYRIELEQIGIDLVVEARAEGGVPITVDAPSYRYGKESLLLGDGASGPWTIEVSSASPAVGSGRYAIRIDDLGGAGAVRLAAEAASTEASRLHHEGTIEARLRAIAALERALPLWRELGEREREASAQVGVGVLYTEIGDPRRAVDAYDRAVPLLSVLGDRRLEAIALNDAGLARWKLGEDDAARALLERALALQRSLGNRYGEAITRNNLCLRDHSRGRLRDALACYREVLGLLRELGELEYEALILSNLGGVYENLGEPRLALSHHRRALALRRAIGDRPGEAVTLTNMAVVHRQIGELQEALDRYLNALEIRRQLGDRKRQAPTLHNIGFAYLSVGEPRRALPFLEEALSLQRETEDRRGEAISLGVLGQAHAALGRGVQAEALYRRALELRRTLGDRRGEASLLSTIGRHRLEAGEPAGALELFDQALAALDDVDDRRERARALHDRGEALLLLDEPERARSSLERALRLRLEIGDPQGEVRSRVGLAGAERRLGRSDAALSQAEAAVAGIESLRTEVPAPDLRARFLASQRQAYELNLDLLMEKSALEPAAGFAERAFALSERARARSLLDLLAEAGVGSSRGVDPELFRRRDELLERINAKATRRLALRSDGRAEHEDELGLYQAIAELDRVEAELRRESPSFAALTRPPSLGLEATRRLLDPETLLLQYALGESRSFLWAVSGDGFEVHELPGRAEIEAAARRVVVDLSTLDPRDRPQQAEAAGDLSRMLLAPVAERLGGRRLVIVADGALHYVPFGVLPEPAAGRAPERPEPLIVRHEVVHLPSASALAAQRDANERRPAPRGWALVLADPVFDAGDPRLASASSSRSARPSPPGREEGLAGLDLGRLPASREEAEAIAAAAPGEVKTALGFDASRDLVLSDEFGRYRIVHFATHGLIHAENPQLSGLVLSTVDRRGRPREGFLRLRDLYDLDLGAELVVLSGCQTALGEEIAGEGLVGLTRGFFYAGVPRVVASLWRVDDRSTAELMARFYRSMSAEGTTPAAALRAAQLSILVERRWRDPYYWGAFVMQGDWR